MTKPATTPKTNRPGKNVFRDMVSGCFRHNRSGPGHSGTTGEKGGEACPAVHIARRCGE